MDEPVEQPVQQRDPTAGGSGTASHGLSGIAWRVAGSWAATLLLVLVGLALLLVLSGPAGGACAVALEFAGSRAAFEAAVPSCTTPPASGLLWDSVAFIPVYAVLLVAVCEVGARAYGTGDARQAGTTRWAFTVCGWLVLPAAAFDLLENASLAIGIDRGDPWFAVAAGMAAAKFSALLPAVVVAVIVLLSAGYRGCVALGHRVTGRSRLDDVLDVDDPPQGAGIWDAAYWVPESNGSRPPADGDVGVCLSGGGIRAATFAMGAVQSLAADGVMDRARYLAAVSGGGYFAAAYQGLRHRASEMRSAPPTTPTDARSVRGAFAPGTPEEDHVRRHGRYISDGLRQWLTAVFVVLRNTLAGLLIVYAVVLLAAAVAAQLYLGTGAFRALLFPHLYQAADDTGTAWPVWGLWTLVALGVPMLAAFAAWVVSGLLPPGGRGPTSLAAGCLAAAAGLAAVTVVAVPALAAFVAGRGGGGAAPPSGGSGAVLYGVTAAVATLATVWNVLSRSTKADGSDSLLARTEGFWASIRVAGAFAVRFLLTVAVVLAVVSIALVLFTAELDASLAAGEWPWTATAAATLLVLLYLSFDQTSMSLHPFYKRRLATAFSVYRTPGGAAAEPDYAERSTLSTYAKPLPPSGVTPEPPTTEESDPADEPGEGLRLLLCAAAHVSGQGLTPPGRRVVPWVFSWDYVGGPRLGYFRTDELEKLTCGYLRKPSESGWSDAPVRLERAYAGDVTLLAAAAISGAAFASSMGRASGPFDLLLALSNARLGAWLPNPWYHRLRRRDDAMADDDSSARLLSAQEHSRGALPRLRRLGYFAREIAGVHAVDDRFVYVTDGGHYENLGLVELLRRGCTRIYCVDASGDHSLAYTLAEAAALAYEELGVEITLEGVLLARRSAVDSSDDNEDLRALARRLTRRSVVAGTFTFPAGRFGHLGPGSLIVGKAGLGADVTADPRLFPVLTYAAAHPEFPEDSTADQWFDDDQFQAYLTLGRVIGERMARRAEPVQLA